jgi:hypothetical protein
MAQPIPDGYRTITAALTVRGGARATDFYTHKEDVAPDEIARRQKAFFASLPARG